MQTANDTQNSGKEKPKATMRPEESSRSMRHARRRAQPAVGDIARRQCGGRRAGKFELRRRESDCGGGGRCPMNGVARLTVPAAVFMRGNAAACDAAWSRNAAATVRGRG
ncbi:hypothetical protein Syun_027483 [Stephania yunnanensis]|uniref:Uncharacterized protein n=1 Tax=Stephania yunnanensis TaxID=152371 RepID=A0AAP0EJ14_9MAGN